MARARAPQHRLDHVPRFVPMSEWDQDIVAKAVLDKAKTIKTAEDELVELEPLRRYFDGRSRFDLDEPGLVEVIAKTQCVDLDKAEVWSLRVLGFDHRLRVFQLDAAGSDTQAHMTAFAHGVVGLKTPDTYPEAIAATEAIAALPARDRTPGQIKTLYEAIADYRFQAIVEIGWAVKQLSSDLFEDERKN